MKKPSVWDPTSIASGVLDEAKKDNFPLGTLRLYTGKMANGNVSSHIYVKVGGKKPWAYYATYPSAKASAAIAAGAMIIIDGKVTGPATPENCALFGVKHPYAGQTLPPLVKGGSKSLGTVGADGVVALNPDSVKEMDDAIAVAKGEAPAPATGETPVAPVPPVAPAPEPEWTTVLDDLAQAAYNDINGLTSAGLAAWAKKNKALAAAVSARYGLKPADVAYLAAQIQKSGVAATIQSNGAQEGGSGASGLIYDAIHKISQDYVDFAAASISPPLKVNVADFESALSSATLHSATTADSVAAFVNNMADLVSEVDKDPTSEGVAKLKSQALTSLLKAENELKALLANVDFNKQQMATEPLLKDHLSPESKKQLSDLNASASYLSDTLAKYKKIYDEQEQVIDKALEAKLAQKQAENKKLADLAKFLKDIGFFDPKKQQDILASPTITKQLATKFGADWQTKAAAGAAALGVPLTTTAPPISGGVVTAPTLNPAPPPPPTPAATPSTKKPEPATAPAAPSGSGLALPELPSLAALKKGGSAKSLGGAGKKDFYSLGKDKYLVKLAFEKDGSGKAKPFAAVAQEVFSTVALAVRPDHVPIRVDKDETGATVTVQPFYEGSSSLDGVDPSALSDQDKLDVATEHLLDWMLSQHDSYAGNLIRRKDGRVVGVDKEQAFRFFPHDKLDVDYNPNPIEPYYNGFWRAFRDNKMGFDVQGMQDVVDKVDALPDAAYSEQLQKYAQSIWPTESTKQAKFVKAALERKQNIRPDFEKFVTDLYRKRTGKMSGTFTFAHGWNEAGGIPTPAKKSMQKVTAKEWAIHLKIQEKEFLPTEGPQKGQADPTKLVLRVHNTQDKSLLEQFLKDTGIKTIGPIFTGKTYHMVVVDKKTYQETTFEKELEKPIEIDPEDSGAVVDLEPHKAAEMNNQDLGQVENDQLGPLGKRFSSDALGVEGQYMRVRRVIDKNGKPYYQFQFKLRPALAASLLPGSSGKYEFPKLGYQPGSDSLVESGEHVHTLNGRKYKSGSSDAFFYSDSAKYTFMNSVTMRVRPKAGQSVKDAFAETLEAMRPGLAAELLKNPTPEEREIAKLARLYWAADPLKADALTAADHNIEELKKRLGKLGFSDADYAKIEERETYPGLQSHVLPGRHKKLAGGKFRFMFNGISDLSAAVSVLKLGLLGISERAAAGISLKGGSVPQDIESGAGDQILARPITESGLSKSLTGHAFHGEYQAIIDPSEADRLDCYVHMQDAYGSCNPYAGNGSHAWNHRKTVEACMTQQQSSYVPSAEIMFRKGIARSKILRIVCQSEFSRSSLIQAAKAAGIVEYNGVSIESFIVVAHTCNDAYVKAVQPALAKAGAGK